MGVIFVTTSRSVKICLGVALILEPQKKLYNGAAILAICAYLSSGQKFGYIWLVIYIMALASAIYLCDPFNSETNRWFGPRGYHSALGWSAVSANILSMFRKMCVQITGDLL